jgi:cytochrome c-type biogenesis protein CcsB
MNALAGYYTPLLSAAFLLYVSSTFLYALFFLRQRPETGIAAFRLCCAGFCAHTVVLAIRALQLGYPPVSNLHESLAFFAWVIVLVYIIVELRQKNWVNGAFVLPLAAIVAGYSLAMGGQVRPLAPALKSPWLGVHVAACFLSYACFLMAFCFGIMYLWQEREVKSKRPDPFFFRLPSLGLVDRLGYKSVMFGFVFLTAGILSGSLWAWRAWGSFWSWDPKETWSLIVWAVYVVYLHGRLAQNWQGRKNALIAIAGFLSVLFTYLGVSFLLPGMHSYF